MVSDVNEIKGAKLMTPEVMAKNQDQMKGKLIVAAWHEPTCKPFLFVGISVNQRKIEQERKHDEYAGYMQDFNLEVKDGEGKRKYLDGHNGIEYFVFDDLDAARKATKLLNELHHTDSVQKILSCQLNDFNKIDLTGDIHLQIRNLIGTTRAQIMISIDACRKRGEELLEELKK